MLLDLILGVTSTSTEEYLKKQKRDTLNTNFSGERFTSVEIQKEQKNKNNQ